MYVVVVDCFECIEVQVVVGNFQYGVFGVQCYYCGGVGCFFVYVVIDDIEVVGYWVGGGM